jgi:predicted DNA-binding WGR domain protein
MTLALIPIDKKSLPKSVSTHKQESNTPPSKAVFAKFEALGPIPWGNQIRAFPGGYVALVGEKDGCRLAILGEKEKTPRLLDHPPAASWGIADLRDGATLLLHDRRGADEDRCLLYEVTLPSGDARCVYDGPSCKVLLGPPGYLVDQQETVVRLIKTDGAKGREVSRREWKKLEIFATHFAALGGRVQLVFSQIPYEIVALGVYGDELRVIATLAQQFVNRFISAEGRVFMRGGETFYEVHGLAEAYQAGEAGEAKKPELAPGELGFRFVDHRDFAAPENVRMHIQLRHERGDLLPCAGGYLTLLHYSRKHHAVAIIDAATLVVRTVEVPRGEDAGLRVDESGQRALFWGGEPRMLLAIDVASGKAEPLKLPEGLGAEEQVLFDFASDRRLVMARTDGVRVFEIGEDRSLIEIARADIPFTHSLATVDAGRVVVVDCSGVDGKKTVALFGLYGDALRLLSTVRRPAGPLPSVETAPLPWLTDSGWRRLEARLFTGITEWNELVGAKETYARGTPQEGLSLAALQYVPPPKPAAAAKAAMPARPTPHLDGLIAQVEAGPARKTPHPVMTALLAVKLPTSLQRLFTAMAAHEVNWVNVPNTLVLLNDKTLADGLETGRDGFRSDLVIFAEDGGGNLYAIDKTKDGGAILFLDHEEGFADRHIGLSIEELLAEQLAEARERGEVDEEDDRVKAKAKATAPAKPRRLVCTEDGANKFWEGAVEGSALTVRWGKVGSAGQTKTKAFASLEAALKELEKLTKEKLGKGYVDG